MSYKNDLLAAAMAKDLRKLAEEYPQAIYRFSEWADFVDDQQRLIDRYDTALENAAKRFHKELVELTPDDVEVILPDELIAEWKSEAGISTEDESWQ